MALFNFGGSWDDLIWVLELACPPACACLFKLRPGVLSKTLSYMWGKLNLPMLLLEPLVGKFPHHINSGHDFVEHVKQFTLAPGEYLSSYDVSVLFTSIPVDPAIEVIKDLLEKDPTRIEQYSLLRTSFFY